MTKNQLRIYLDNILDNPIRRQIYQYIKDYPGAYPGMIKKGIELQINNGYKINGKNYKRLGDTTIPHHLKKLQDFGYIKSEIDGFHIRYYIRDYPKKMKIPTEEEEKLKKMKIRIIEIIENNPGLSQADIARILDTSRKVVNYHVNTLKEKGLVKIDKKNGKSKCYLQNK